MQKILLAVALVLSAFCPGSVSGEPFGAREMETFFDGYLSVRMPADHVAGAVVSVVKDGAVLFSKGYGYADVAHKVPVDPGRTVFTLGSLTKVFTWTAVMQLVERGQLDLDADINTYLDFTIPPTFPQPITLANLMAHNAGFEDNRYGQMAPSAIELVPLGEWLKTHIPARVQPPGQVIAYGNYGAALAGYIVQRVSGLAYEDYVQQKILSPLGMKHTSTRQPFPTELGNDLSLCYRFENREYQPQPAFADVALNPAPAGSARSDAADMARFMIAHLGDGSHNGGRILEPATTRLMHTRSFSPDPRVNGMAHGFWEMDLNGQRILGHAGSHFIFNSQMMLFPDHHLGVFIATNSEGGSHFIGANYFPFQQAFVQQFFPATLLALPPLNPFQRNEQFTGTYHLTYARSETTPEKLLTLLMGNVEVRAEGNDLSATLPPSGNERFVPVEPMVFRNVNSDQLLVFQENAAGGIVRAFYGLVPLTAMLKNQWYEAPALHLSLLGIASVFFFSELVGGPIVLLLRRWRVPKAPTVLLGRVASCSARVVSLVGLLVLLLSFGSMFNVADLYLGRLPLMGLETILSMLFVVLTLGILVFAGLSWKGRWWSLARRVHYSLLALAAVGFVWFLNFWNLLGKAFG